MVFHLPFGSHFHFHTRVDFIRYSGIGAYQTCGALALVSTTVQLVFQVSSASVLVSQKDKSVMADDNDFIEASDAAKELTAYLDNITFLQ